MHLEVKKLNIVSPLETKRIATKRQSKPAPLPLNIEQKERGLRIVQTYLRAREVLRKHEGEKLIRQPKEELATTQRFPTPSMAIVSSAPSPPLIGQVQHIKSGITVST
ncbi:hypothetical protein V8G54_005653 [Vigna mungo]|uniref:Uncharacterized protein n=1 Tax=Vigna mungo TaxID=3915 RepID=A0AAQ3S794_VIGMU